MEYGKDLALIKHQLGRIMEALKIQACPCHEGSCPLSQHLQIDSVQTENITTAIDFPTVEMENNLHSIDSPTPVVSPSECETGGVPLVSESLCVQESHSPPTDIVSAPDEHVSVSNSAPSDLSTGTTVPRNWNLQTFQQQDPSAVLWPLKVDKTGRRRFYSQEQRVKLYQMFRSKGLKKTTQELGVSVAVVKYNVRQYMLNKKFNNAYNKRFRSKRLQQKPKNVIDKFNEVKKNQEENKHVMPEKSDKTQAPTKLKSILKKPPPVVNDVALKPSGNGSVVKQKRRYKFYPLQLKKAIFNHCIKHGHRKTIQDFGVSTSTLSRIVARFTRQNPTELNDTEMNTNQNNESVKSSTDAESNTGLLIQDGATVDKPVTRPDGNETTDVGPNNDVPNSDQLSKPKGVFRNRLLDAEQESLLVNVLRRLEGDGIKLTPKVANYSARQVIELSSNAELKDIKMSYWWGKSFLKRYNRDKSKN